MGADAITLPVEGELALSVEHNGRPLERRGNDTVTGWWEARDDGFEIRLGRSSAHYHAVFACGR